MNIESILIQDTNGDLAKDIVKNNLDKPALSAWFSDVENTNKKVLNFSANNVRYDSIPNIQGSTYMTFLTYNGTSGYTDKLFATIVASDEGIFDRYSVPVLVYNPMEFGTEVDLEVFDDIVIDIKMYNGTIDVLNYADSRMGEGPLTKGDRGYIVKSRRSFPTKVDRLPNIDGNRLFLDGWYTYTQVIFRDLNNGDEVVENNFYTSKGKIFKATKYGVFFDGEVYDGVTTGAGGNALIEGALSIISKATYEEILFSLNETADLSPQSNSVFLHSQVLITEELRYTILQEIIDIACKDKCGCDFMDWQSLQLKRIAAAVMFENGMFEKAQIILESARAMCLGGNELIGC